MRDYAVVINNVTVELENYNVALMESMEKLGQELEATKSVKDKLKKKYDFIATVTYEDTLIEALGKFEDADPNDINIAFDKIISEYDRPYNEHTMQEHMKELDAFNSDGLKALTELSKSVSNIKKPNVNQRYAKKYF